MANTAQKLSTNQRMQYFAALTRQNMHMLPTQETHMEHDTIQIILPKTRVLAKTYLQFEVDCSVKHASKTKFAPVHEYDLFNIVERIAMDVNVGFMPVSLTGKELAMFNTVTTHPHKLIGGGDRMVSHNELVASTTGANNKYTFVLEVKNTLNDNMLNGLIMLQNQSTTVTMNIDIGMISKILGGQDGYTATLNGVKVTPMLVTYTIPKDERAYPDVSILKVVHSKNEYFPTAGTKTVYLDCGMIYRKIVLYFEDENGVPMTPDKFTGKFELRFNTADTPYSITPEMLKYLNIDQLGQKLPDGMYVFDFSSQSPLIGFGGNRDYIDTGKITEFTLTFNSNVACKTTIISERISRLTV